MEHHKLMIQPLPLSVWDETKRHPKLHKISCSNGCRVPGEPGLECFHGLKNLRRGRSGMWRTGGPRRVGASPYGSKGSNHPPKKVICKYIIIDYTINYLPLAWML